MSLESDNEALRAENERLRRENETLREEYLTAGIESAFELIKMDEKFDAGQDLAEEVARFAGQEPLVQMAVRRYKDAILEIDKR